MTEPTPPAPFEGQAAFDALSAALADAVVIVGPDGAVSYSGPGLQSVLGLGPADVTGRPLLDLVHPDDAVQHEDRPFWTAPPPFEREVRMRNGHGGWSWVRAQSSRIRADGEVPEAVARVVGDGRLLFLRDRFEGTIRDASDLIQRAFDAVNNLVVVADARLPDLPLVVVNQNFLDTTGYERHEVVGQNCRFLQTRPDGTRDDAGGGQAEALERVRAALASGGSTDVVLRNYRKDGTLFYNRLYVSPVHDAAGGVTHFVGVQNDVTAEVEQAEVAASQRGLIASFFDSAPVLMGVVERDGAGLVHRTANGRAVGVFGVEPAAVGGARPRDLGFSEREAGRWEGAVDACARSGEPVQFETAVPWDADPDGDGVRALRVTVSRVRGGSGPADLYSYIGEDVTEARRADRERRLLAAAVDAAAESIVVTDDVIDEPGPRVVYANEAHARIFGYAVDEILGRSPRMYQGPKTDRSVLDRVRQKLEAGEPSKAETVNYRKDGSEFVLQWEIAPVRGDDGRITNWVGTQRDVTERRRLEHEVLEVAGREQERMARELHDGLGQLLTGTQMKLAVLERALERLGERALAADAARSAEIVGEAHAQARAIARGLFPVNVEPDGLMVALERLVGDARDDLGVDASFSFEAPVVVGSSEEAGHLYRVVQEAMTNAVRHGGAGRVVVGLAPDGDGTVALTVQDDGSGIPDEALDGGGGLGMRTMAYRARRVGGVLDVRRLEGGGTAVRVRFTPAPAPAYDGRGGAVGDPA